jgi:membrane protein
MGWHTIWEVGREIIHEYRQDKVPKLAASFSYLTVFALAPLLLISIAVAGFVVGRETARERIVNEFATMIGPDGAALVRTMIEKATLQQHSGLAAVIGVVTLILTSAAAFADLQESLNMLWGVKAAPKRSAMLRLLERRLVSFGFVLVSGFLLLVSLVASAAVTALSDYMGAELTLTGNLLQAGNFVISLLIVFVLFSLMYKLLPDVRLSWREVRIGAAVTTLLFVVGKSLIGIYLGRSATSSLFGAAGALAVLLLWIYYSAIVFFLGAEFTFVYQRRFGSGIQPAEGARPATNRIERYAAS